MKSSTPPTDTLIADLTAERDRARQQVDDMLAVNDELMREVDRWKQALATLIKDVALVWENQQ